MVELGSKILDFIQGPLPPVRSVVIRALPPSDGTLLLLQLVREIHADAYLALNYVNVTAPWHALRRRYPFFKRHFNPALLSYPWMALPTFRTVPTVGLQTLLDWVTGGGREDAATADAAAGGESGGGQEIGDKWRSPRKRAPSEPPSGKDLEDSKDPILREFERLWDYVERARSVPVLLLIDSIDALGRSYGVKVERLVRALQEDLVDTGHAVVVYTWESRKWAPWLRLVDGVLSFSRVPTLGEPHWSLAIDRLPGYQFRRNTFELTLKNGRLSSRPSDKETADDLLRRRDPLPSRGLPKEILRTFQDREHWGFRDSFRSDR